MNISLDAHFMIIYSLKNFIKIFSWLYKFLNIYKCLKLKQFYLKNKRQAYIYLLKELKTDFTDIYANLISQIIQYLWWIKNEKVSNKYNYAALQAAFDELAADTTWDWLILKNFACFWFNFKARQT